jgi:hypothetical protein
MHLGVTLQHDNFEIWVHYHLKLWDEIDPIIMLSNLLSLPNAHHPRAFFMVQLQRHVFLVEPLDVLFMYLACGKPFVNMAGEVFNNFQPLLEQPHDTVQPSKLLNCIGATGPKRDL